MGLLRRGADPDRLAWSLALGLVVGVNPLLGSTTQVGNHAVYPLEILMFPVFIKLGDLLFGTVKLPLEGSALWHAAKYHPWRTTRLLWTWEWHALVVWAMFAVVAVPGLAMGIRPVLEKMARRVGRKQASSS
jgi:hypothetical protein